MIVDDLRALSPSFRTWFQGGHVFRVPYEVAPWTTEPDGIPGLWWQDGEKVNGLVPKRRDETDPSGKPLMDTSWWKPPYARFAIVSEHNEPGALFVVAASAADFARINDVGFVQKVSELLSLEPNESLPALGWDWMAQLSLVVIHHGVPLTIQSFFVFSDGEHLVSRISEEQHASLTAGFQAKVFKGSVELDAEVMARLAKENPQDVSRDRTATVCGFAAACGLLTCKNIDREEVRPPEKLQRARLKRGKLPLVSYHVLKVKPFRRKHSGHGTGKGEALAAHWVRGHFKTFTKEKPLLGRAVGTYWWYPHLAGRADRVVHKSYEIIP